jgi:hypothetical protein
MNAWDLIGRSQWQQLIGRNHSWQLLLLFKMFIRFEKILQNHQVTLRLFMIFQLVKVDSKSLLFH